MLKILISINVVAIIFVITINALENTKYYREKLKKRIERTKLANSINEKIRYIFTYTEKSKYEKILNSIIILSISLLFSIVTYFLSIIIIKIPSTAVILSSISFFIPYIVITIIININISKIKTILPSYIVNIKNNMEITNNIIRAISITRVEKPLEYSINRFNFKVSRGLNVYECFDELKKEVNIQTFSSLIDAFKVCHQNGGSFITILDKYIDIISKENIEKSKLKENSETTIITLIVMVIINILLMFSVVLGNLEYRNIILETTMGHIIINFTIISYLIVMYFVYRIYKMEG